MSRKDNVRSVALGCDHGAVGQKEMLKRYLQTAGCRVVDVGCVASDKVDYPDIAVDVCRRVVSGDCERGIVLDGAGIGSCMGQLCDMAKIWLETWFGGGRHMMRVNKIMAIERNNAPADAVAGNNAPADAVAGNNAPADAVAGGGFEA